MIARISPNDDNRKAEVTKRLTELAKKRNCPVVCIYHDQFGDEIIDNRCVEAVRDIALSLKGQKRVSILLDSPGGDIEDAYRMLKAFYRHVGDVEVIVSNWAKSAATFFCLGAKQVLMGPDAELGPLDPQLPHPGGSSNPVSPLETFQGLEHLRTYAVETLDAIMQLFLWRAHMDIPNAIKEAEPYVAAMVGPLYQQVNPHEMGELGRHLRVSEEYAKRAMRRWGYPDLDQEHIDSIVHALVWDYPTHGFVIDLYEAKRIGLNAEQLDDETDKLCKEILKSVNGCTACCQPCSLEQEKSLTLEQGNGHKEGENAKTVDL